MQGQAAAKTMPVAASNRVGLEKGERLEMTLYGSSFIADHTGAKVAKASRMEKTELTAKIDLYASAPITNVGATGVTGGPRGTG